MHMRSGRRRSQSPSSPAAGAVCAHPATAHGHLLGSACRRGARAKERRLGAPKRAWSRSTKERQAGSFPPFPLAVLSLAGQDAHLASLSAPPAGHWSRRARACGLLEGSARARVQLRIFSRNFLFLRSTQRRLGARPPCRTLRTPLRWRWVSFPTARTRRRTPPRRPRAPLGGRALLSPASTRTRASRRSSARRSRQVRAGGGNRGVGVGEVGSGAHRSRLSCVCAGAGLRRDKAFLCGRKREEQAKRAGAAATCALCHPHLPRRRQVSHEQRVATAARAQNVRQRGLATASSPACHAGSCLRVLRGVWSCDVQRERRQGRTRVLVGAWWCGNVPLLQRPSRPSSP